jgi:hypothetical protein
MRDLKEFHYHKVSKETAEHMAEVRQKFYELASYLDTVLPPNQRATSICFTHLEESSMRAIQALALMYGEKVEIGEVFNG